MGRVDKMPLIPPRYEAREYAAKGTFGVWDTFAYAWAWRADKTERFTDLDERTAHAQADALNRIYERAL